MTAPIVNLALRRRAQAENLLIEAQVRARDYGTGDVADLIRSACVLLTAPPPRDPANNVIAFARKAA